MPSNFWKQGQIKTIDDMMKEDFIIVHNKVYHRGWFTSWPCRLAQNYIGHGVMYYAYKTRRKEDVCKSIVCKEGRNAVRSV